MEIDEYQVLALGTASAEGLREPLMNAVLGLCGESGEVADHIKKWKFQDHKLDMEYLAKELGDICWYIALMAYGLGLPLSNVMEGNIKKLKKRYPDGFSAERSINREKEV